MDFTTHLLKLQSNLQRFQGSLKWEGTESVDQLRNLKHVQQQKKRINICERPRNQNAGQIVEQYQAHIQNQEILRVLCLNYVEQFSQN